MLSGGEGKGVERVSFPESSPGIAILSQGAGGWEITGTDQHLVKGTDQTPWHNKSFPSFLWKRIPTSLPNFNSLYLESLLWKPHQILNFKNAHIL